MAISPGFVFYGRYSIHEVWLFLFSMMFILGLLGLWKFGTPNYLWCAGLGVAGMILTKETYIIHLGCAALAVPVLMVLQSLQSPSEIGNQAGKPGITSILRWWSGPGSLWSSSFILEHSFIGRSERHFFRLHCMVCHRSTGHGHDKAVALLGDTDWCGTSGLPSPGLSSVLFARSFKNLSLRYLRHLQLRRAHRL